MKKLILVILGLAVLVGVYFSSNEWIVVLRGYLVSRKINLVSSAMPTFPNILFVPVAFSMAFFASVVFKRIKSIFVCVFSSWISLYLVAFLYTVIVAEILVGRGYISTPITFDLQIERVNFYALIGSFLGTIISAYFLKRRERKRFPDKSNDELLDVD